MPDERCKECGMLKPPLAIEQGDDFCSTECARRHYENSREERTPVGGQTRRRPAPRPTWNRTFRLKSTANGSGAPTR